METRASGDVLSITQLQRRGASQTGHLLDFGWFNIDKYRLLQSLKEPITFFNRVG